MDSEGVIVEKQKSVCNDHCSVLQLHCPRFHRIAIREALYGVHSLNSACPVNMDCSDAKRDICCEMVGGMDCLFPYPLDHLNSFHTNCSGKVMCSVEMDHKQAASSACSTADHRNVSSYSLVDYVCVNATFTAEICSETEISVIGRTLFAIYNPHDYSSPLTDTSCTCTARSHQWRTATNYISSFAVDLRLTAESGCSDTELFMASGGESQDVTCETSKGDSWFLYPFVSILNSTGDSMARLTIGKNNPDFVWIGFEGSFDEDIVLTCKRDKPHKEDPNGPTHSHGKSPNNTINRVHQRFTPQKPSDKTSPAWIAIGTVLGLVVMAVFALIILWLIRRKSKKEEKPPTVDSQNQTHIYADCDEQLTNQTGLSLEPLVLDATYSTVEEMASMGNAYAVPWEYKKATFDRQGGVQCNGASARDVDSSRVDSDGFEDVYFTPEPERRSKYLQDTSPETEDAEEDLEDKYVSVEDIKRNKRAKKKVLLREKPDDYDKLEYNKKSPDEPPPGYSKLGFFTNRGYDSTSDYSNPDSGNTADTRISKDCDRLHVNKPSVGHPQGNTTSTDPKSNNRDTEDTELYANSKRDSACYANTTNECNSPYELAK
ncbi:uncharacterized protein LOC121372130 isoform X2 [Gigantopelta aegis]|uniref:uncharacterized protein LOC121372130 isoform X2 n=1 Tax=Gigantopelta aegis TaxID=1735272 RepID=UPI001B888A65|nr:uncharacterized protein LOC121372130 isoform X2 [Gigantopelta aegis]